MHLAGQGDAIHGMTTCSQVRQTPTEQIQGGRSTGEGLGGAPVLPGDERGERPAYYVHAEEAMHLAGQGEAIRRLTAHGQFGQDRQRQGAQPVRGLLGPGGQRVWEGSVVAQLGQAQDRAALDIQEDAGHRGGTEVKADDVGHVTAPENVES